MTKITIQFKEAICKFIGQNPDFSSKQIYDAIGKDLSYATLKRALQELTTQNYVLQKGKGKGTTYRLSPTYELVHVINIDTYFQKEIDQREIKKQFNHELMRGLLKQTSIFTQEELRHLSELQNKYRTNSSKLSKAEYKKELERLAIDLSWKSSQIEGNTYSLLETERLLREKETAAGKTKNEASMLLNHKDALDFIITHPDYVKPLSLTGIEVLHSFLIKDLDIDRNIRKRRIGISGTNYTPLDNEFQIKEALLDMCILINNQENVFTKALLALVLISYIQPFADGNKRTARIISNAILMNNQYCPISFRTVDSTDYKKSILVFYEQNNISAMKSIFISQFEFAVNTYF